MPTINTYDVGHGKTYATIAAAESATASIDHVTDDEISLVRIYREGASDFVWAESPTFLIDDQDFVDATRYRQVVAAESGLTFTGVWTIGDRDQYFEKFLRIGTDQEIDGALYYALEFTGAGKIRLPDQFRNLEGNHFCGLIGNGVENGLIDCFSQGGVKVGDDLVIRSNVIFDFGLNGEDAIFFEERTFGGTCEIAFNTVYNYVGGNSFRGGFLFEGGGTIAIVRGNVAIDANGGAAQTADMIFDPTITTAEYNVSSDTSAPTGNETHNEDDTIFEDAANDDLTPADADTLHNQVSNGIPAFDMFNRRSRPQGATADIGGIEREAAGGGATPAFPFLIYYQQGLV